jgi:Acetyltransferase (GNAT) domain
MPTSVDTAARTVVSIDPLLDARYDAFVAEHEGATAYHLGAWAQIQRSAYGYRPSYLALAGDGGQLEGVLPLMYTRGLVSGRRMRSLPGLPVAGPLGTSREAEAALVDAGCRIADRHGGQLVMNGRAIGFEDMVDGLSVRERFPSWITPLSDDPDELRASWKKRSNNLWRSIRKAEKAGVTVREGSSEEDLRTFYDLYLQTMKRHRSLPRAWRQMAVDRELLGPSGVFRLFIAEHQGRAVAAGVFHAFRDTVDLLYNGSDTAERDLRANFALYWHAIRWSAENGFRKFDWGEAKEGGTLSRFKAQWSAEPLMNYTHNYVSGAPEEDGPSRADRIRRQHDVIDVVGVTTRRDKIVDRVWEHAPTPLTRVAGAAVYRLF